MPAEPEKLWRQQGTEHSRGPQMLQAGDLAPAPGLAEGLGGGATPTGHVEHSRSAGMDGK